MPINLLPWRQQRQFNRGLIELIFLLAGGVLLVGLIAVDYMHVLKQCHYQQQRNHFWQQHIEALKVTDYTAQQQRYQQLVKQIKLIQQLRQQQIKLFSAWQVIVNALPKGIVLQTLTLKPPHVMLKGIAAHSELVSELMAIFQRSHVLGDLLLTQIHQVEIAHQAGQTSGVKYFTLEATLVKQTG